MEAADNAFQIVRSHGHRRFVLSSGCTLAMETPAENLDAVDAGGQAVEVVTGLRAHLIEMEMIG